MDGVGNLDQIGTYLLNALVQHPAVDQAFHGRWIRLPVPLSRCLSGYLQRPRTFPGRRCSRSDTFLALDRRWPIARMSQQDG